MGQEIAKQVTRPLQLCTHDLSKYCLDECSSKCHLGYASCRVVAHHTGAELQEDDEEESPPPL